jgi:hypothetical protein
MERRERLTNCRCYRENRRCVLEELVHSRRRLTKEEFMRGWILTKDFVCDEKKSMWNYVWTAGEIFSVEYLFAMTERKEHS